MADRDKGHGPKPTDGLDGGDPHVPPIPRPRYIEIVALGLAAVGVVAGLLGKDDLLLILCGASAVAGAASLVIEGWTTCPTGRR